MPAYFACMQRVVRWLLDALRAVARALPTPFSFSGRILTHERVLLVVSLSLFAWVVAYPSPLPSNTTAVFRSGGVINGTKVNCIRIPSIVQAGAAGNLVAFAEGRIHQCSDCTANGILV